MSDMLALTVNAWTALIVFAVCLIVAQMVGEILRLPRRIRIVLYIASPIVTALLVPLLPVALIWVAFYYDPLGEGRR